MTRAPESSEVPALEMRGVTVGTLRDPDRLVAEGVTWTVSPGEFWVIGGLQGSGKSDLLMMTAGLMPPRAGQYRLLGQEMPIFEESRLGHRLRLGLVFDGGQLLHRLTVLENVALPLRYHQNRPREEIEGAVRELLTATDLLAWAASTPGAIPRPWQKRAGLARALTLRPEVLLLDCPLSGLDARHTNWWLNFLGALARGHPSLGGRPLTLVATSEDLRPWRGWAHRFALLQDRRFTVLGDWTSVEQNPDPAVRALLGAQPTA